MRVLFGIVIVFAVIWTAFVLFANMMKQGEMGGFIGANTLVVAWLIVGILAAANAFG